MKSNCNLSRSVSTHPAEGGEQYQKFVGFQSPAVKNCQTVAVYRCEGLSGRLAILKNPAAPPHLLVPHCTGSHYCDRLNESCLDEETWPDKSPGNFTELLIFPHSNSPGPNWVPLIRFPCCNWQLLIRCCQLLE